MSKLLGSLALPAAAVLALGLLVSPPAQADTVSAFGNTTGTGPWDVTSNNSFSGVGVNLSTPLAFNSLTSLSANFTDISGGDEWGSPRFLLFATNGDFFDVYLGAPGFNEADPLTFTSDFSGVNLNNSVADAGVGSSAPYYTLASLESTYGGDLIDEVDLVLDGDQGGNLPNGPQELTLNSFEVNGSVYGTSAVPEPASLALFGTALAGLMLMWRRKRC